MKRILARSIEKNGIDWVLFAATLPLLGAGLVTMHAFVGESDVYFQRQIIWIGVSIAAFFMVSFVDTRIFRRTYMIMAFFSLTVVALIALYALGHIAGGAQSWFSFGGISFQPSDPAKIVIILLLAKYFSRRHIEIANIRHIIVSGLYASVLFVLVFFQPDFGSAIIILMIWFGMVVVSGISKKHFFMVIGLGVLSFLALWLFVFEDYQKQRIVTFINPLTDIQGAGYNAHQSAIAVGSGQLLGKGVGLGTQSRLHFLPEFQTDFVFAAFAEEWGFVGVIVLFLLFAVVVWRILDNAIHGASNFETLFGLGLAIYFVSHFIIHIGMNIGLLPVTGTTIPFLSYGGSHLLTEFIGLGILMAMRRYRRALHREDLAHEISSIE